MLNKEGEVTHYLEPPSDNVIKFISKDMIKDYKNTIQPLTVKCQVLDLKEIYIDAHKKIFPCCFIASMPYTQYDSDNITLDIRSEIKNQSDSLISDLGGLNSLDASIHGIKTVINSPQWQNVWQPYWDQKKLLICARTCGVNEEMSRPHDQFLKRDELIDTQSENVL